ncbi:unnamed protein product [Rhizophagus irregularis]|nr:unnamed protein product [Rhizophagus irregularis]
MLYYHFFSSIDFASTWILNKFSEISLEFGNGSPGFPLGTGDWNEALGFKNGSGGYRLETSEFRNGFGCLGLKYQRRCYEIF